MTYATVMVSLALDQSNEARLEAAGQIAERFDAGIIGIVASQFSPPLYFTSGEQAQNLIDQGQASIKKAIVGTGGAISSGDKKSSQSCRMALRHRLPGPLCSAGSALRRHHCQRWRPGCAFGPARDGQPERSGDAGGPAAADGSRCRRAGSICEAFWSHGRIRARRGGRSPIRCPCSARRRTSPSRRSWRRQADGPRRCRGSRTLWRGCHVTVFPLPNSWRRRMRARTRPLNWT